MREKSILLGLHGVEAHGVVMVVVVVVLVGTGSGCLAAKARMAFERRTGGVISHETPAWIG
jgi:hypothetical protein